MSKWWLNTKLAFWKLMWEPWCWLYRRSDSKVIEWVWLDIASKAASVESNLYNNRWEDADGVPRGTYGGR
jgi:hypothetical protein